MLCVQAFFHFKDLRTSTKSGTSRAHVSPCRHTDGLERWDGKTTRRNNRSMLAAYVSKVGKWGRKCKGKKGYF